MENDLSREASAKVALEQLTWATGSNAPGSPNCSGNSNLEAQRQQKR